jgi:hypothetical protein
MSSRDAATMTEAAASQADSNVFSPSGPRVWASARSSSRITTRGSDVSTCSRTMSSPTRAEVRQCTWRRSSPTTYSRSAANVMLPWGTRSTRPSMLRDSPTGTAAIRWMRGRTQTLALVPYRRTTPTRPSGSRRLISSGPTSMTPRRDVGTG